MTPVHAHLVLNHVPIFGATFGFVLLLVATLRGVRELQRAGLVVFVVVGVMTVAAFLSGTLAETSVATLPDTATEFISPHESFARLTFVLALAAGALASWALVALRGKEAMPRGVGAAVLALGLACCGSGVRTANLGGKIRHPELRGPSVATHPAGETKGPHHGAP